MRIESSYPVVMTEDPAGAGAFFARHFGFATTFAADWYVSLKHPDPPHPELAFLHPGHATIPAGRGAAARGILLNLEVADARAAWERLGDAGIPVLLPLRDEPFGQRHFILDGPAGVLVDVIENIPPSPEFAAAYAQEGADA